MIQCTAQGVDGDHFVGIEAMDRILFQTNFSWGLRQASVVAAPANQFTAAVLAQRQRSRTTRDGSASDQRRPLRVVRRTLSDIR